MTASGRDAGRGEAALTKYEGAALVTGTYQGEQVTGQAYLELVGDWS